MNITYLEKQNKRNRTSVRLPHWMEHQCKRLGVFDNKNTSEIIKEALFEYLELKDMSYANYLKVNGNTY